MWEIISNPVTLSVIVMCVLCLCKLNVILSLLEWGQAKSWGVLSQD